MRGGSYTDAASYGMYVNGTTGSQWSRTMDQAGPYGQVPGNVLIGAQGQNVTPTSQMPTSNNLKLIQSGAGRRRRRGGFIGEVINQAIVPLSLLGMQQSYGRRKRGGKTLRKRKGGNGDEEKTKLEEKLRSCEVENAKLRHDFQSVHDYGYEAENENQEGAIQMRPSPGTYGYEEEEENENQEGAIKMTPIPRYEAGYEEE
jgi:hypothetical protein